MSNLSSKASHNLTEQASEAFDDFSFVCEEKPGQSKRNFSVDPPTQEISIPFQWEERPGKPKSSPKKLDLILLFSPITSIIEGKTEGCDDNDGGDEDSDTDANEDDDDLNEDKGLYKQEEESEEEDDDDQDEELFELDLESCALDENHLPVNNSASTPLPIATCMQFLPEMSCSIPMPPDETEEEEEDESCCSESGEVVIDSGDDGSSYIEFIFPLNSPQESGFVEKVLAMENRISVSSGQSSARPSCCRVKCVMIKGIHPNFSKLVFASGKTRRLKTRSGAHMSNNDNSVSIPEKNHAAGSGTPRKETTVLGWWRKKEKPQNLNSSHQHWWKKPIKQSWGKKK